MYGITWNSRPSASPARALWIAAFPDGSVEISQFDQD